MPVIEHIYKHMVRPIAFRMDPEVIHERVLKQLKWLRPFKPLLRKQFSIESERLEQKIWGYTFPNPIGLAGGFDKNALCTDLWEMFGFGFLEIGTVTPRPQQGNTKPRLFRYPESEALVNRMGFNNDGSDAIAKRLEYEQSKGRKRTTILGISIGKQKVTPPDDIELVKRDYLACLKRLYPYGDFFVVNVSSPNTPRLRELQKGESLATILSLLKESILDRQDAHPVKPLLVKFAPDLRDEEILDAVDIAMECGIDGIIATNTTNQTAGLESGGLSGRPLRARSTEVVKLIAKETKGQIPIIGCGGIFTAQEAIEKLEAGACLIQTYTGFVYEGPTMAYNIQKGILNYMNEKGLVNVAEIRTWKQRM